MRKIKIYAVKSIRYLNWLLSGISIRLVKWTGKATQFIHPKHLLNETPEWIKYFSKNDRVLDIGCHNGQRDFKLAPFVESITAFDYDTGAIQNAKKWQQEKKIKNIAFLSFSAEKMLPFKDESFDKILFMDVIEHLNNRDLIMKECFRVLRKNGVMVLVAPNKETPWKIFQKNLGLFYYSDNDHKIEYSREELLKAHKDAGFEVLEVKPVVYDFPFFGMIDIVGGISLTAYGKLQKWKKSVAQKHPEKSNGFMVISKK